MIIIGINFHRNISIEVLVSGISDRSPQFQHIQPTGPFQKMFVVDIPSKSHRPGIGKKFVHPENGSPVCPPVGIQQITVVISITEIHIIAGRPFLNILIYFFIWIIFLSKRRVGKFIVDKSPHSISVQIRSRLGKTHSGHRIYHMPFCQ